MTELEGSPQGMSNIRLCAIAKNEGPYLVDWVFHHLHFGVDSIEVWVNDTDDASERILRRISKHHPQVRHRRVDNLLEQALDKRRNFQHLAYRKLAKRAARDGCSHVLFLDIDELWTPRDFATPLREFVPRTPDTSVVSFPWALDVPDQDGTPFRPPFAQDLVPVQMHSHVKSVVRLDQRLIEVRTHTARTSDGARLLVDEPFPLESEVAQQWGSFVPEHFLRARAGALPTAFVFHRLFRSQVEYLATIGNGLRQTGQDRPLKTNRRGYLPSTLPILTFAPPRRALARYRNSRRTFRASLGAAPLTGRSIKQSRARASAVIEALVATPEVRDEMRDVVRGLTEPRLVRPAVLHDGALGRERNNLDIDAH